jgi:hypothetical protein
VEICTANCSDSGHCTAACTNSKENVQYKKLGILNSNQLSRNEFLDSSSTNPTVFSIGNAPNSIHNARHILTDEVYTNLEKSNAKKAIGIKSNKYAQKYLTPVTIGWW